MPINNCICPLVLAPRLSSSTKHVYDRYRHSYYNQRDYSPLHLPCKVNEDLSIGEH